MKIKKIKAREIIDSRGQPTIAARVYLDNDMSAEAMVPSGASTGSYEAVELRDNDKKRFNGLGVLQAIENVEEKISPALINKNPENQEQIDNLMIDLDGTNNKNKLGANAILAVSLATARVSADSLKLPLFQYLRKFNKLKNQKFILPMPMMNILNGGRHANWATDIQEYMVIPVGAESMSEAIRMSAEIYQALKQVLKEKKYNLTVGDEGGFAPSVKNNSEAFELLVMAVEQAGYILKKDIIFGVDVAATEFFVNNKYHLKKENLLLDSQGLSDFYYSLRDKYPIYSWEDIFSEDDWLGFFSFHQNMDSQQQIVGDDLYVTNIGRLQKGINEKASNSILIKLNQIGTLTETIKTIDLARDNNFSTVISHRSGETEDTFIADLAIALDIGQIKTGAPARSERTAKYNRLLEIEAELKDNSTLASFPFFS